MRDSANSIFLMCVARQSFIIRDECSQRFKRSLAMRRFLSREIVEVLPRCDGTYIVRTSHRYLGTYTSPDFSELMWLNPIGQSKIVGKIVALSSPRQFLDAVSLSCVPLTVDIWWIIII